MAELTITENPVIHLKKAVFDFDDDFAESLDPQEREELAEWIKTAILFYLGGRQYRLLEQMRNGRH